MLGWGNNPGEPTLITWVLKIGDPSPALVRTGDGTVVEWSEGVRLLTLKTEKEVHVPRGVGSP